MSLSSMMAQHQSSWIAHDQMLMLSHQLREEIRSRIERELRALYEPVLLEAVDEAMRAVSSRLVASRRDDNLTDVLNITVNLRLKVEGDDADRG